MSFSETDEISLSKDILENLKKTVDYQKIKIDGALKAAELITAALL